MPSDPPPAFGLALPPPSPARAAIAARAAADEDKVVRSLLAEADLGADRPAAAVLATRLVDGIRSRGAEASGLDSFLAAYDLSTQEGVVLMCLAEALLRIPDPATADALIAEKLGAGGWERHLGQSDRLFVNASTWALMLTGRFVRFSAERSGSVLQRLLADTGEAVLRQAMRQAMRIVGGQFVLGRTIAEAMARAATAEAAGDLHSYDMLGEQAFTAADADAHADRYHAAIAACGRAADGRGPAAAPGVSVKLSALHPRFVYAQRARVLAELGPRLADLARAAEAAGIGLCIDSEEAERFDLTLDVVQPLIADPRLAGWEGLGLAIQAYQKRARPLVDWLGEQARRYRRRLALRLVKGAYWDWEIKRAQELGLAGYPVFTRKANTDVSYLAIARALLGAPALFRPAFATHNAATVAQVLTMAERAGVRDFEFQRLHGMGEALYASLHAERPALRCRIYAPVGDHRALLSYLVRRLLENGSNTSFVNRLSDARQPVARLVADPVALTRGRDRLAHPRIPLPRDLFAGERLAAAGEDLSDPAVVARLARAMAEERPPWAAAPLLATATDAAADPQPAKPTRAVVNPADRRRLVGRVAFATAADVDGALAAARQAQPAWDRTPAGERASILRRAADRLEADFALLARLCVEEAGKTVADALADVREAVDFCRYYAARGEPLFGRQPPLPGPTGEENRLSLHGRGVFACISPWNFPVAIFTGQVAAALMAGNAVVAKPAPQTCLVADRAARQLHAAGVPEAILQVLPGAGDVGQALVADGRVGGVAFTGSLATARAIAATLAARPGPIVPLIAETGGENVMLVCSSALPEQVTADVLTSAFRSAGQRCSALRVLCLQEEIAPPVLAMLTGAMAELAVGDPWRLATDVGPVIDAAAQAALDGHVGRWQAAGRLLYRCPLPPATAAGSFVAPALIAIDSLDELAGEVFGPVLHVLRFRRDRLDALLTAIADRGYGLTLGIHSRLDGFVATVRRRLGVGNVYVNRSMIGATVGVQPFGGEGLSGTGPKAGGPFTLPRFAVERVVSVNTVAAGGNAALLALDDTD